MSPAQFLGHNDQVAIAAQSRQGIYFQKVGHPLRADSEVEPGKVPALQNFKYLQAGANYSFLGFITKLRWAFVVDQVEVIALYLKGVDKVFLPASG